MNELELLRKLGKCDDKEQMSRCIDDFEKAQKAERIQAIVDKAEVSKSCEDENTEYITFPDGLRLIFRDGKYVGWYVCGGDEDG